MACPPQGETHYEEVVMKNGTWRTLGKAVSVISIAALSLGTLAA